MQTTSRHALTHSLDLLADTYNYNHWIYSLLRPFLGPCICEIGAGIGNLSRFFLNATQLICIEPEAEYWAALDELSSVHLNMHVFKGPLEMYAPLPTAPNPTDTVVCINVLEHIQDDAKALQIMSSLVGSEGAILLYVPACSWAFGALDRALGHHRRYSRRGLWDLANKCQLHVSHCRHVNFIGAFGWWWVSRIRAQTRIDPEKARVVDRFVPFISAAERLLPPFIGQSLFAVLRKQPV